MNLQSNKANVASAAATVTSAATQSVSFDTSGYDFANVKVLMGTSATTSAVFNTLKFSESDTVTSPSSMTDIVALTGGTETSTSVGFVLPTDAVEDGGVAAEFQIDLRKRKKYLGLQITPGQSLVFGTLTTLTKDVSADSTTGKTETNLSESNVVSCATLVTA